MIMCVQESGAGEFRKPKFDNFFWADKWSAQGNGKHSIGIMVRKSLLTSVDDITNEINENSKVISSSWIKIRTHESKNRVIIIGNFYVPCHNNTPGNITKRKKTLSGIRNKVKYLRKEYGSDCKIMLCGDFHSS